MEIVSGLYGWAPPGRDRLVLGHESLGRVVDAPAGAPVAAGDLVWASSGSPTPCRARNLRGGGMGFLSQRPVPPSTASKSHDGYCSSVTASIPNTPSRSTRDSGARGAHGAHQRRAKAWEQVDRIGGAPHWDPQTVVVTGAGPIGLLAAMIGVATGLDVHVFDQVTTGTKPDLVHALGATYNTGRIERSCPHPDVVIECNGPWRRSSSTPWSTWARAGWLVSPGSRASSMPEGGRLDAQPVELVLENQVVVGRSTANHRHYGPPPRRFTKADRAWISKLVTRRVPLEHWQDARPDSPTYVKVVIEVGT